MSSAAGGGREESDSIRVLEASDGPSALSLAVEAQPDVVDVFVPLCNSLLEVPARNVS